MLPGRSNEESRQAWLARTLAALPVGARILDAGAGELRNKPHCSHLRYVSQDFCQYGGEGDGAGLQTGRWDTSRIDLVCDISAIPEPDASFDAILCSEVLEHVADPTRALDEFARLLKPGGKLILTAPFCSLTHFAPYHYASGFNRYWYEHHLEARGFDVEQLAPNGNWFQYIAQELWRLPHVGRTYATRIGGWIALAAALPVMAVLGVMGGRMDRGSSELLCYGWHVVARRRGGE